MAAEARGPSLQSIAEATTAWSSAFNRSIKERYALLQRSLEVTGATLSALPKVDYMSLRNAILLIEQHNALLPPWTPQVLKVRKSVAASLRCGVPAGLSPVADPLGETPQSSD